MSDLSAGLEALAGRADIEGKAQRMQQFRADFKMVWGWYRHAGYLSQPEYEREFAEAGQWVKDRIAKPEIGPVMDAYRTKAAEIERDIARSERIRAEEKAKVTDSLVGRYCDQGKESEGFILVREART